MFEWIVLFESVFNLPSSDIVCDPEETVLRGETVLLKVFLRLGRASPVVAPHSLSLLEVETFGLRPVAEEEDDDEEAKKEANEDAKDGTESSPSGGGIPCGGCASRDILFLI